MGLGIVREQPREDQQAVQRGSQLVRHVGQEFGLVRRDPRQLPRLVFQIARPIRELRVRCLELFEQPLGPRRRRDRIEDHSNSCRQLLEKHSVNGLEPVYRPKLDDAFHFALEQDRHDEQAARRRRP